MTEALISGVVALTVGILIGRFLLIRLFSQMEKDAKEKAQLVMSEAKAKADSIEKEKRLEADERLKKLQRDHEKDAERKKKSLHNFEKKLKNFETKLKQQNNTQKQKEAKLRDTGNRLKTEEEHLEEGKKALQAQQKLTEKKQEELEHLRLQQIEVLEKVAGMQAEDARKQLMDTLADEARSKASSTIRQILEEAQMKATKEAKRLVLTTIQRTATEHAIENCVSVFHLESDDIKGKIIGREGRNIRALESATGVEIIVDDTPEAITISGFDPVRREIARLSLEKLVADGRIHPARIEEVVAKVRKQIEEQIIEIGERTVIELGVHGLHPELIKLVGKMRFRSSYGQNLLQHSREVAKLCSLMASELGLNAKVAKRAGLLHDIGKVYTEEPETPHALLGMKLAERFGEKEEVCNAIGAHHDEIEMTHLISPIVQACDAISGARPGARRETMESYLERLRELESMALSYKGVNKCYAIQAGRELRVMVDADKITDERADEISFSLSQQIERDMQYPGQIKVTVIRERRAISFAK